MKKFFKIFGWVFLGIFLQFKFNVLYGIVFLENLNFHDRTYFVKMNLTPTDGNLSVLHIETTVHHSLGPDYFANVYIPDNYKVLNRPPYKGAESIPRYQAYQMNMKRRYRDVLSSQDFLIVPKVTKDKETSPAPIFIDFENMKQKLHTDKTYHLGTVDKRTRLEGPEIVEAIYPQRLGM